MGRVGRVVGMQFNMWWGDEEQEEVVWSFVKRHRGMLGRRGAGGEMWRAGLPIVGTLGRLGRVQCNLWKRNLGEEARVSTLR